MAEPQPQNSVQLRKKKKKSRYLKQGYHKSERDDYRRVAARAFLSGITRDSHLREQQQHTQLDLRQAPSGEDGGNASSLTLAIPPARKSSIVPTGDAPSPPSTPVLEARYSPVFRRTADLPADPSQQQLLLMGASKSLDQALVESHSHHLLSGIRTSHSVDYTDSGTPISGENRSSLLHVAAKWPTTAEGAIYKGCLPFTQYYETGRSWRLVCTSHTQTIASVSSVLPYYKHFKSRHDTQRERMRVRGNSFSLQMDLEGVELGTTTEEVSLEFLLHSIWINLDSPPMTSDLDGPALLRRGSIIRRSAEVTLAESKRSSTPTPLARYHVAPEGIGGSEAGPVFRGDHRFPVAVILSYHPLFLNNDSLFASPMTTTLTPPGYRVSIIEYARKADMKRGLNERFKEIYPHVELPLSKLIKLKRKMHEVAIEKYLDLAAVAYAYVYFEKLVLMGKVNKSVRRPVAGVCLLLAAKFVLDLKKKEINELIEEITDNFRLSSRELLLYEFPVLAVLQFSLLTPNHQARYHHDKLLANAAT